MSTTLYNGLKFPNGIGLEQAYHQVQALRGPLLQKAQGLLEQHATNWAASLVEDEMACALGWVKKADLENPLEPNPYANALSTAWMRMDEGRFQARMKNARNPFTDMQAELVVIPHETGVYALSYVPHKELLSMLRDALELEEFAYWNNTDPPENMDDVQWKARGELWDELLGPLEIPAYAGMTLSLITDDHFFNPSENFQQRATPTRSLEERAKRLALLSFREHQETLGSVREVLDFNEQIREGRHLDYNARVDQLKQFLPDPLPREWLTMKHPERQAVWDQLAIQWQALQAPASRSPRP